MRKFTEQYGELHRHHAFGRIEKQGQNSKPRGLSRDVCGTDVAAARAAHVFPTEDADQQIAEWDRAQKIAADPN